MRLALDGHIENVAEEVRTKGYALIPNVLGPVERSELLLEVEAMAKASYSEETLSTNAVYISDKSPTRESYAMMVAEGESSLPTVPLIGTNLRRLFVLHNDLIAAFTGRPVPSSSRSMLNFQHYRAGSKVVAEHYDGHYMEYDKLSPTEFKLHEGILPRYVMVFNIMNQNDGEVQGTTLRNIGTGETVSPPAPAGSLLIFDNIAVRHSVQSLDRPRVMLGFRNFDHVPYYFSSKKFDGGERLEDRNNPGWVFPMTSEYARETLARYYQDRWPTHWAEIKKSGAVF